MRCTFWYHAITGEKNLKYKIWSIQYQRQCNCEKRENTRSCSVELSESHKCNLYHLNLRFLLLAHWWRSRGKVKNGRLSGPRLEWSHTNSRLCLDQPILFARIKISKSENYTNCSHYYLNISMPPLCFILLCCLSVTGMANPAVLHT